MKSVAVSRDQKGWKQLVNAKTVLVFTFFIGNIIKNGNFENGNDIDILETSETKSSIRKKPVTVGIKNTIGKMSI